MKIIPIRATTLTPFNYGHLAVQGGVATIPEIIGDRAVAFSLAATLGMMHASVVLPQKDFLTHLGQIPWKASVFVTKDPRLLPPLARRSDLGVEGGYQDNIRRATGSGNFKEFFTIQEVPAGQIFRGALFGEDPFEYEVCDDDRIVARIGSNRTGMVLYERDETVTEVRMSAATAALFGCSMTVEHYFLEETQLTPSMSLEAAAEAVMTWN